MNKFKKILEFIIALLNFLFHFTPEEDKKSKAQVVYPKTLPKHPEPQLPDPPPIQDSVEIACL